jgi:hypothetical protein
VDTSTPEALPSRGEVGRHLLAGGLRVEEPPAFTGVVAVKKVGPVNGVGRIGTLIVLHCLDDEEQALPLSHEP